MSELKKLYSWKQLNMGTHVCTKCGCIRETLLVKTGYRDSKPVFVANYITHVGSSKRSPVCEGKVGPIEMQEKILRYIYSSVKTDLLPYQQEILKILKENI